MKKIISFDEKVIFVTGVAGFIGAHLVCELLRNSAVKSIIGMDNMNEYYDVKLKEERLRKIQLLDREKKFIFIKNDISDIEAVKSIFHTFHPQIIVNLAAQAGVRYSIQNPDAYIQSNIIGFYNMLEACRQSYVDDNQPCVEHFIYASSSSVYGNNKSIPYHVADKTDMPVSFYAATKKSAEIMAYSYAKLYKIPCTGLRFFTVYGPQGRPDMAYFLFADKLKNNDVIKLYNYGNCKRDFTYIDDIIDGIVAAMQRNPDENEDGVKYALYNLGNNKPESLLDFVDILQQELTKVGVLPDDYDFESHKELVPMQPGDVEITFADIEDSKRDLDFFPKVSLREGLKNFAEWYAQNRK